MMTDQFLINSEKGHLAGKRYQAVYKSEFHFFTASSLKEAKTIAREYGSRMMNGAKPLLVEDITDLM
jgi:hypothetical protein